MEPVTLITTALSVAKMLGLDRKFGKLLGGDKGAVVAGKVMDAAQVLTGASTPEEVKARLEQDQAAREALALRLQELAAEEDRRVMQDKADARAMQIAALSQDDLFTKRFVPGFALLWSIAAIIYVALISFYPIPEGNVRVVDTVLGFLLGTIISTIITFFFGSSRSSQNKDAAISGITSILSKRDSAQ